MMPRCTAARIKKKEGKKKLGAAVEERSSAGPQARLGLGEEYIIIILFREVALGA
jgi:hypothetical protein